MTRRASVMILAAGHATRLRPLTEHLAKAMVPFLNRPLLDYALQWLAAEGFDRVVVNLHHAANTIRGHYGATAFGVRIDYSEEDELLGTAGGPRQALPLLGSPIVLVNGDVLARVPLSLLLRHHRESGALATLGLYAGDSGLAYPQVMADRHGRLRAFPGERVPEDIDGPQAGVFTGIHVVERQVIESLPAGRPLGIVTPVYRDLLATGGKVSAVPVQGFWYEVGEPDRYLSAQMEVLRRGELPLAVAGHEQREQAGYVARDAEVLGAHLAPPYLLGARARIASGARCRAVVLGADSRVEADTEVDDAVLWEGARVDAGCRLRQVVVMGGVTVPRGTVAERVVFTARGQSAFSDLRPGATP